MQTSTLIAFTLVTLVTVATPGPTMLLALSNGTRLGMRRSLPGMLGAVLSDFVLVGAVALGLGALLAASEFAFTLLKWVGAAYLAWLGLRLLRSQGGLDLPDYPATPALRLAPRSVFARSFLVAVTNPKGYLFCSALLPQFIDPSGSAALQGALLSVIFVGIALLTDTAYVLLAGVARQRLGDGAATRRLGRHAAAATLVGLGVFAALSGSRGAR